MRHKSREAGPRHTPAPGGEAGPAAVFARVSCKFSHIFTTKRGASRLFLPSSTAIALHLYATHCRQTTRQLTVPPALHVSALFTEAVPVEVDPSHFFSVAVTRAVAPVVEMLWFS